MNFGLEKSATCDSDRGAQLSSHAAACTGGVGAMYNLGMIYLVGHGVTQDGIEAYKWFELSAQAGAGQERDRALRAKGIGHSPFWEDASRFNRELAKFMNSLR